MIDTSKTLRYQVLSAVQTLGGGWHSALDIDQRVRGADLAGSNSSVVARLSDAYNAGLVDRKKRSIYSQNALFRIKHEYQSTPVQDLDNLLTTWVMEQGTARVARRKAAEAAEAAQATDALEAIDIGGAPTVWRSLNESKPTPPKHDDTPALDIACASGTVYNIRMCDMKEVLNKLDIITAYFK